MKRHQPAHWVGGMYSTALNLWFPVRMSTESELVSQCATAQTMQYKKILHDQIKSIRVVDKAIEEMMK